MNFVVWSSEEDIFVDRLLPRVLKNSSGMMMMMTIIIIIIIIIMIMMMLMIMIIIKISFISLQ